MDLYQSIDIYCERMSDAFWAEPINAITNLAFIVAGLIAILSIRRDARQTGRPMDLVGITLAMLVILIGVGSFLFHTVAQTWAMLADVIPIFVYIIAFIFVGLRRFLSVPTGIALAISLLVAGTMLAIQFLPIGRALNGSAGYLPAFLAMALVAITLRFQAQHTAAWLRSPKTRNMERPEAIAEAQRLQLERPAAVGRLLYSASLVFLMSLILRTVDADVCPTVPIGTHFLWHVLNAVVLYLTLEALRRDRSFRAITA